MLTQFARTELLLGGAAMARLAKSRVAVFGIGGVGSYAAEALARSGVGALDLIDDDVICLTNLNRQLMATHHTVGQPKTQAMRERILAICPQCQVQTHDTFFAADTAQQFDLAGYDAVLDCIDTVSAKLVLVELCHAAGTPLLSCMGTGNKLDATRLEFADIFATRVCPLARVMRRELKKRGVPALRVLFSLEEPQAPRSDLKQSCKTHCVCPPGTRRNCTVRRQVPGSTAFVPAAAGLMLAGDVVRLLVAQDPEPRKEP